MCPYLEESDSRCSVHLSLHALEEALGLCAYNYQACPIYREKLRANGSGDHKADEPVRAAG